MFDDLIRELERLEGTHRIPVSIQSDVDGYLDRECPSAECEFEFKVCADDWRDKIRDEEVFCPFCGHTDTSNNWCTAEQVHHLRNTAIAHMRNRIDHAMRQDADNWNRQQPKNDFISITLEVTSPAPPIPLPPLAADPMRLKITCPACACRYAVVGAAFFCPACCHNAADLMFSQAVTGIRGALDSFATVRASMPDLDAAETTARLITEFGLQNAVTAFQRYAEALYGLLPSPPPARRNAFQNLTEGSTLWHKVSGKHFSDYLADDEMRVLTRCFQQRHLLAHTQGLIDVDYIKRTGDTNHRVGQRVIIRAESVWQCLLLLEKLTAAMATDTIASA